MSSMFVFTPMRGSLICNVLLTVQHTHWRVLLFYFSVAKTPAKSSQACGKMRKTEFLKRCCIEINPTSFLLCYGKAVNLLSSCRRRSAEELGQWYKAGHTYIGHCLTSLKLEELTTKILKENSNRHKRVEMWAKSITSSGISDAISLARHSQKSSQDVRASAAGDSAICSKNRKIVPAHSRSPNTRNGARLRSSSPIVSPICCKMYLRFIWCSMEI